ncbi:MAG: sulfatase-like hydrolase/transferase, partial [Myxococcota bacterium]|nr:sulfatase-like hydrolase/transferase [Myxococcota bacterium]
MTRRALGTALVAAMLACGCARQPDVVVLFVDTLRADRLGCSAPLGALPSLERYTIEGSCFERVSSTAGWTLPTETSMLVSAYPEEHNVTLRHVPVDPDVVPITAPLADAGFMTALFSGNVLTAQPQFQPFFDQLWVIERSQEFAADVDDRVVDEALDWLAAEAGKEPLFLVLQLYGPHYPYCPPGTEAAWIDVPDLHDGGLDLCDPDHADLLRAAESLEPIPATLLDHVETMYDEEVAYTDTQIERFEAGWEALGRRRDRVTVVITDHGEAFGEHGKLLHGRSLHRETSDS